MLRICVLFLRKRNSGMMRLGEDFEYFENGNKKRREIKKMRISG